MKKRCLLLALLAVCGSCAPAIADWINLSGAQHATNIAEIRINDDHVKVDLEIFVGDLMAFDRLIPDEFFEGTDIQRPPAADRLRAFAREDFQIKTDTGQTLEAQLELIEWRLRKERASRYPWKTNPYTGQPMPGPPEDKRVLYAELVYPLGQRPAALTIVPPLDEQRRSKASIGFMTYHKGVPIHDFKYLSGPSMVTLDWEDPWYSAFDNKALKRWQTGGVMSFLYIEPYEVRHEILARVKDVSAWMDLELQGDDFIEADENGPLKRRVGEFFLKRDKVLVDGKQLKPILDRVSFVKYSPTASVFVAQPEQMPIDTAMVGVIITYLTPGIPQEVRCEWDLWSDHVDKVPTDAIDPAGGFPSYVTPQDNEQVWTNFLKKYTIPTVEKVAVAESLHGFRLPLGSLVCGILLLPVAWGFRKRKTGGKPIVVPVILAGLLVVGGVLLYPYMSVAVTRPGSIASSVSDEQGKAIVDSLLVNVYRAYDFRDEEDVYDKLAVSASGDLLKELYLQNRESFQVQQAGGAQAKVTAIEVQDVQVTSSPKGPRAMTLRSRWTALGTVGHWGHIHTRQNQYEADITVEPVDGSWKITELELIEEQRITPDASPGTGKRTG